MKPLTRMNVTENQKAELHLTWKRLNGSCGQGPVESGLFHRIMNHNIRPMGILSKHSLQLLHNVVETKDPRVSGNQENRIVTHTPILRSNGSWTRKYNVKFRVSFEQSTIHHYYRYNTQYNNPDQEYPIMQHYAAECRQKRKQGLISLSLIEIIIVWSTDNRGKSCLRWFCHIPLNVYPVTPPPPEFPLRLI